MKRECRNRDGPIEIKKVISVLPNDYVSLENKPSINGIVLDGELDASSLNLLSSKEDDYEPVTLSQMQGAQCYLLAIGEGKTYKISVDDFIEETKNVTVTDSVDPEAANGTISFVILDE